MCIRDRLDDGVVHLGGEQLEELRLRDAEARLRPGLADNFRTVTVQVHGFHGIRCFQAFFGFHIGGKGRFGIFMQLLGCYT